MRTFSLFVAAVLLALFLTLLYVDTGHASENQTNQGEQLQKRCSFGANMARSTAKARLNGVSEKQAVTSVMDKFNEEQARNIVEHIVVPVYDLSWKQVQQPNAIRKLFFQSCMNAGSTKS